MATTAKSSKSSKSAGSYDHEAKTWDYVTMRIAGQLFGIPVLQVQDVLGPQRITRIPLAPPEVAGSLNLETRPQNLREMSIVVEYQQELYSLIVDEVGEVLSLAEESYERNPATMDNRWREVSSGIHRLDRELLVILDIGRLLSFADLSAA